MDDIMKFRIFIGICLLILLIFTKCALNSKEKRKINEISKLELICKVWGFIKYYHPKVYSGEIDWDKKLLETLTKLDTSFYKNQVNNIISELINNLGDVKFENVNTNDSGKIIIKHAGQTWLEDTSILSQRNSNILLNFYKSKQPLDNHYVTQDVDIGIPLFENEKKYSDSLLPSENLRLLSLFRYWNIINYFYPHLEINDRPWDSILIDFIPQFIITQDTLSYHLKVLELTSQLNDGHIWTESWIINLHFGIYCPPIKLKSIENFPVIESFFSDSLANNFNIKPGDQLIEINNEPIENIINRKKKYYSYSNSSQYTRRILEELLITSTDDTLALLIDRYGERINVNIKPYLLYELYQIQDIESKNKSVFRIIDDSIGYINLKYLENEEVDFVMNSLMAMKKIIIDIRNYPKGVLYKLSEYFNPSPINFVRVFIPNIDKPGEFVYEEPIQTGIINNSYYRGKIILLVDEQTQSHAEFTVMCLQTAPNVITIGSTTAGTDGNVSHVYLPGGIITYFTGIGIEYPDGTSTQRIGIKIDSIIQPKIRDLQNNYDRLIDVATQL